MRRVSQLRALSAVAVLLVIPGYGDREAGSAGTTVTAPATAANARVGALFDGGLDGDHFCTASVVHSEGRDVIVTAAHCLDDQDDAVFVPGYRDGAAPYGTWPVKDTYTDDAWQEDRSEDDDVAFAVLGPGSLTGARVEDVVGAARLAVNAPPGGTVTVVGYPGDSDTPQSCTTPATPFGDTQQRVECPDYPGGTSGSPWTAPDGAVVGVIGGYEEGGDDPDVSYSVRFGGTVGALYQLVVDQKASCMSGRQGNSP
ncbi:trypsin-like serine peptidase [Streptomyces melanogenes]|uniref:Trypsin-like peptidase domain-containing protein n=1 Tax=Streptomyces melanogenes TaxID=67326 RepID=A0ABZ1XLR5_9ACTN|nr:trypsin-like peptidase domain-containing protein [Streptomyces melanogenes]